MKTGFSLMKVTLKLFFERGSVFDSEHPYTVRKNGNRKIAYARRAELQTDILTKYQPM